MLKIGVVGYAHVGQIIAKFVEQGCILCSIAALSVVFTNQGAIFVFVDLGGILELANGTMKTRRAFTTELRCV